MKIQSCYLSNYTNNNISVKKRNTDIIQNKNDNLKDNSVSFGAISIRELAKASNNYGVRRILQTIQADIDNSAVNCLSKITQDAVLPEKSWWGLLEIIEKYSSNAHQMPFLQQTKNVFACPQVAKEKITTVSGEMIKSEEIKIKLNQLLIESMNENTLVIAFKNGNSDEIFVNKGHTGTLLPTVKAPSLTSIDNNIMESYFKNDFASILKNPFKLPSTEPLSINAVKITSDDIAYKRHEDTFQDLLKIDNILIESAESGSKTPDKNLVSYTDFLGSIEI